MELFDTIDYLATGNFRQQAAYKTLIKHDVIQLLQNHTPILAGTIPLDIDIKNSDLDILCYWQDKYTFINALKNGFSGKENFTIKDYTINNVPTVKANFIIDDFEVEVFGQNKPVHQQYAYRHMIIEHEILQLRGDTFKKEIIRLKENGIKTEPAFAQLLGLEGNAYEALLLYKPT